jgi:transcriptional regulator with XRE-family HTH domain
MHGMNLAAIRKRLKLSQAQLAEKAGVDQTTISRAERMAPSVTLEVYYRIARVLGVSLADIFGPARSEREERLLRTYRALREGKQIAEWEALLRQVLEDDEPPEAAPGGKDPAQTNP